jgi:putative Holliday junction resolvase
VRIIGIDFGERRIGVAAADDRTRIAIPLTTLRVEGDAVEAIVQIAGEERADELVVGLPLSLSGAEGPQAQRVREVVEAVSRRLAVPVRMWDERLTTAQARRQTAPAGRGSRGRRATGSRSRKQAQDAVAAAILLQAYMDSIRPYD